MSDIMSQPEYAPEEPTLEADMLNRHEEAGIPPREEMDHLFKLCRKDDWDAILQCALANPNVGTTLMTMDNHITTTILHQAITSKGDVMKRAKVVEQVLDATPKAATIKNGYGSLPLHVICQRNTKMKSRVKEKLIFKLINAYPGALIEEGGTGKRTPLHIIFTDYINPRLVDLMIEKGADACFMRDKKGWLPVHVACSRHCSPDKLRMLLRVHPASLHETTNEGKTLLDLASASATRSHPNFALIDELNRYLKEAPAAHPYPQGPKLSPSRRFGGHGSNVAGYGARPASAGVYGEHSPKGSTFAVHGDGAIGFDEHQQPSNFRGYNDHGASLTVYGEQVPASDHNDHEHIRNFHFDHGEHQLHRPHPNGLHRPPDHQHHRQSDAYHHAMQHQQPTHHHGHQQQSHEFLLQSPVATSRITSEESSYEENSGRSRLGSNDSGTQMSLYSDGDERNEVGANLQVVTPRANRKRKALNDPPNDGVATAYSLLMLSRDHPSNARARVSVGEDDGLECSRGVASTKMNPNSHQQVHLRQMNHRDDDEISIPVVGI